jgi:hypothetical protein
MIRRLSARRTRALYSADHADHLRTGSDFFGNAFGNGAHFRADDAAEAWESLREEILAAHIAEQPCTRPWAWWRFEEHDARLCVSPAPRGPEKADEDEDDDPDGCGHYGVRSPFWGRAREELLFESQAHFLRRYGLLTKAERAYLDRHPELLEPVNGWDARNR